jgi:hypothetical protein
VLIDSRRGKSAVENKNWQAAKFTFNKNLCSDLAGVVLKLLAESKTMKRWAETCVHTLKAKLL